MTPVADSVDNSLPLGLEIFINAVDSNGLSLNCKIEKFAVDLLVDSGSPVTILDVGTYRRLPVSKMSLDRVDTRLWAIGKKEIPVIGKTVIRFTVSGKLIEHETLIADLGFDFVDRLYHHKHT